MKGTLAVAAIVLLLASSFTGLVLWLRPQQVSTLGGSTDAVAQLWNFQPAGSQVSVPVVSDGYVYFVTYGEGGGFGILYCIKASSGSQVWNYTGLYSDFSVENGSVYATNGTDVLCLNAFTGAQLWNFGTAIGFGSPLVSGNIVFAGCVNNTLLHVPLAFPYVSSDKGVVYALNAATGAEIWNYSGPPGTCFNAPLVVTDGNVYAVSYFLTDNSQDYPISAYSGVYALQASTGEKLWNYSAQGCFTGVSAGDGNVYVGCGYYNAAEAAEGDVNYYVGGILAFDDQTGQSLWNYTIQDTVSSFTFAGGNVYLVSSAAVLYALNPSDGSVNWNYTAGTGLGSLLPVNGYLYVGSSYGVYCFNMSDGTILWNFAASDFAGSSTTNPVYADGEVYVGWNGPTSFAPVTRNNFYSLDALNGRVLWNYTLGYTDPSVAVSNGVIYIGGDFVTTESPDNNGLSIVLALKPEQTLLVLTTAAAIVIVILTAVAVLIYQKKRKTKSTRGVADGFA